MGLINKLFKKKEPSWKKEKFIPEFHKCPMCGEMVKTHVKLYSDNPPRYLDGEMKVTTEELVNSYQFCEHCGYIYEGYDYEFWGDESPNAPLEDKKIVNSETYQKIFKDEHMYAHYKKLLLFNKMGFMVGDIDKCELYYEYKYQFEKGNTEEEQRLLELKLQDVIGGKNTGLTVGGNRLCYGNKWQVGIHEQEITIDILRRLSRFDEAKKLVTECMEEYKSKGQEEWPEYEYYTYQLGLIETRDNRHI